MDDLEELKKSFSEFKTEVKVSLTSLNEKAKTITDLREDFKITAKTADEENNR